MSVPFTLQRKCLTEAEQCRKRIAAMESELARKKTRLMELEGAAPAAAAAAPAAPAGGKKPAAAAPAPAAKEKAPRGERFELVRSVGEECQEDEELATLLHKKEKGFRFYDGFEPSGRMHVAQGLLKTINVNKCTAAGGTFVFWVADWFALMNDKMGGSLERIQTVGEYLIEVWKAAGMRLDNVQFIWSSEEINKKAEEYWTQMLDVARYPSLRRMKRCCQIMGRQEGSLSCAQILYPLMQCTDIFFLRADVCQLGLDQKKVNMLAREYVGWAGSNWKGRAPIVLSHHMMRGLLEGQEKMSKSDPFSAVFMEDDAETVVAKINNASCSVEKDAIAKNPLVDVVESIVFGVKGSVFTAGGASFDSRAALDEALTSGKLDVQAFRDGVAAALNERLEPVRKHFKENDHARSVLALVKKYKEDVEREKAEGKAVGKEAPKLDADTVLVSVLPTPQPAFSPIVSAAAFATEQAKAGKKVLVLVQDWTAYALNVLDGSMKNVKKVSEYILLHLRSLLGDAKNVEVKLQSEHILTDPGRYWVGVINAGRRLSVAEMGAAMGKNYIDDEAAEGEKASEIIAGLMCQGDLFFAGAGVAAGLHSQFAPVAKLAGAEVAAVPDVLPCSREGYLDAEPAVRGGKYPDMAVPQVLLLEDNDVTIQSRVKKAYCKPGEVDGNPVLAAARGVMRLSQKPLAIAAKGGEAAKYATYDDLHAAYAAEKVHPADLKATMQGEIKALYAEARKGIDAAVYKKLHSEILDLSKRLNKPAKGGKK